jgi:hypothetical protein
VVEGGGMTDEQELRQWAAGICEFIAYNNPYSIDEYYYTKDSFCPNNHGDMEVSKAVCLVRDYRPDSPDAPMSQLLGVIEEMRRRGWLLKCGNVVYPTIGNNPDIIEYYAEFYKMFSIRREDNYWPNNHDNSLSIAILKAAKATGEV